MKAIGNISVPTLFLMLIMFFALSLKARESSANERNVLRSDRSLYITGEYIRFKAWMPSADFPFRAEALLYVELIDHNSAPVIQKKFAIHGTDCSGSILLPHELLTGNYYLRAYTSWMKNAGPGAFAYQPVSVINPFMEISPESGNRTGEKRAFNQASDNELIVRVDGLSDEYATRNKVEFDIQVFDSAGRPVEGSFLISVVRKGLQDFSPAHMRKGGENPDTDIRLDYPPEWGGHLMRGRILPNNGGGPFRGDTILYSVVGKSSTLNYSIADSLGNFSFRVKPLTGTREVVIQNFNPRKEDYHIILEDPFSQEYLLTSLPPFRFDTAKLGLINKAVVAAQVGALYSEEQETVIIDSILSFYGTPENQLIMANYMKLPEMWEVFFELIPQAQMRIRDGEVRIRMMDNNTDFSPDEPPLLLIDGVFTRNNRDAADLDPTNVERIHVVNRGYCFGKLKFPGIISFITEEGTCPVEFPSHFFRQAYEFLSPAMPVAYPDYEDSPGDPRADFRNTLYWDPELKTGDSGRSRVEFYTSDENSEFVILIEGMDEHGRTGSFTGTISVRER